MTDLLELSVSAAASGCIYALVALAYLLMIRPTGIINFAVGEWAMVGAFGGFLVLVRIELPYPVGFAAVLGAMLLVGWATERIAVRPLVERGAPLLAPILALQPGGDFAVLETQGARVGFAVAHTEELTGTRWLRPET